MAISFNEALGTYESALKLRAKRAEVLSSNLVNADTPNYQARDFDFHSALKSELARNNAKKLQTTTTDHLNGGTMAGVDLQYRTPTQPSIDGNTVDEHLEHSQFMQNSLEFQTTFTLLNSRFKGLVSAIRGE